jgi:hypothetical protein
MSDILRAVASVAVAAGLAAVSITATDEPAPAAATPPPAVALEYGITGDSNAAAAAAIADVVDYISTTTTTSTYRRPATAQSPASGGVWDRLAVCESGGDWSYPLVSGTFSGGLMFATSTWVAMGGPTPYPFEASREQQIEIAERTLAVSGWGAWPGCSSLMGLR